MDFIGLRRCRVKEDILNYIKESTKGNTDSITEETDLFKEGILDSFGIIALLVYLQENYNVTFSPDDLLYENYQTVEKIVKWVEEQLSK